MKMVWYGNAELDIHIALPKRFIGEGEFNLSILEQNAPHAVNAERFSALINARIDVLAEDRQALARVVREKNMRTTYCVYP